MENDTSEKIKTVTYIPGDLHKRVKIFAAENGTSISSIMQEALTFYLKNYGKEKPTDH